MAPPTVTLPAPPNGDYGLYVIKQTGTISSGGGGGGGNGVPDNWGLFCYPNPGGSSTTSNQGGSGQGPSSTATANLRFYTHGGTLGGVTVPGTGLKYSCFNAWQNVGGDITSFSNGWKNEGGAFAPTTGMIPLQAIASMGPFTPSGTSWSSITSGASDSYIRGLVDAWASAGYKKVIYRIDWEWQIGTGYGGTYQLDSASKASQVVPVWQHMYTIIKDQASKHSGFEALVGWNPTQINYMNFPCSNAYPGDGYCDVIQTDMYFSGGQFDNSGWDGYSSLTPGSVAQLNGGSPGTIYSSQKALYQNPNIKDMLYHWADFPGATQYATNGRSAVSGSGDKFGTESAWGVMDLIHFGKLHNKPIGVCEGGQWSTKSDSQENLASTGAPTYNVGTGCYAWPGIPDIWMIQYWKSRIAYAQSIGVNFLHFNFFSIAPNNPFYINDSTSGQFKVVPDVVQSINNAFAGTGVALNGYTI